MVKKCLTLCKCTVQHHAAFKIRRGSLSISAHICLGDTIIRADTERQMAHDFLYIKVYNLGLTEVESTLEVSEPRGGGVGMRLLIKKYKLPVRWEQYASLILAQNGSYKFHVLYTFTCFFCKNKHMR